MKMLLTFAALLSISATVQAETTKGQSFGSETIFCLSKDTAVLGHAEVMNESGMVGSSDLHGSQGISTVGTVHHEYDSKNDRVDVLVITSKVFSFRGPRTARMDGAYAGTITSPYDYSNGKEALCYMTIDSIGSIK